MQDSNFRYLIKSTFDGRGAEQAKAAARDVAAAAHEGSLADRRKAQEAQVFEAEAIRRAKQNAEATDTLTSGKHRLRDAIRGVALQFPALGRLTSAFINPWVAGLGLATAAITSLYRASQEFKTTLASSEWKGFADVQRETAKAAMDAAYAVDAHARKVQELENASRSLTETLRAETDALKSRNAALQEIENSEKELALARVNAAEKEGKISGVEAAEKRARIEEEYARKRKNRADSEAREVLAMQEAEAQGLQFNLEQSAKSIAKLQGQLRSIPTEEVRDAQITRATTNITAARERMQERQERLDKLQSLSGVPRYAVGSGVAERQALPGLIEGDQAVIDRFEALLSSLVEQAGKDRDQRESVERNLAAEKQFQEQAFQRRNALEQALPGLREQTQLGIDTRQQVFRNEQEARTITTGAEISGQSRGTSKRAAEIVQAARASTDATLDAALKLIIQAGEQANKGLQEEVRQLLDISRAEYSHRFDKVRADSIRQPAVDLAPAAAPGPAALDGQPQARPLRTASASADALAPHFERGSDSMIAVLEKTAARFEEVMRLTQARANATDQRIAAQIAALKSEINAKLTYQS